VTFYKITNCTLLLNLTLFNKIIF